MLTSGHPDHCSHKEKSFLQISDDDPQEDDEGPKRQVLGSTKNFKEAFAYVQKFQKME